MEKKKHSFGEWMIAVRPWSFPASAMPVLVTMMYAVWRNSSDPSFAPDGISWLNGIWALLNIVVFHAAGNTWSDYFDYRKKVDADDTFGAKTLTSGMFAPREIMILSISLLAVSLVAGVGLLLRTGLPLLWIGLGGVVCTLLYPTLKFRALGDFVIFAVFGLLASLGTVYAVTGEICPDVLWIAVPVGLITVAILHANNARDIETDDRAGIRTIAMNMGVKMSVFLYGAEVLVPFAWLVGCVIFGIFPACSIAVLGVLPLAWNNAKTMYGYRCGDKSGIGNLDEKTAKLQLVFSLLFSLSFIVACFI